jgi:hypothetical protein
VKLAVSLDNPELIGRGRALQAASVGLGQFLGSGPRNNLLSRALEHLAFDDSSDQAPRLLRQNKFVREALFDQDANAVAGYLGCRDRWMRNASMCT